MTEREQRPGERTSSADGGQLEVHYRAKKYSKTRVGERFCALAVDGVGEIEAVDRDVSTAARGTAA